MKRERIQALLKKYQNHNLTDEEKYELNTYLSTAKGIQDLKDYWDEDFQVPKIDEPIHLPNDMFDRIISDSRLPKVKTQTSFVKYYAAASIVLLLSSVLFFYYYKLADSASTISPSNHTITAGSKDARMQFDDGSFIELSAIQSDTVLLDKGIKIKLANDGSISYELLHNKDKATTAYTTVVTAVGSEYNLTLSDGTKVWLNSSSKVKYPLSFDGATRDVFIEGEVFFDVSKYVINDKKIPFNVFVNKQKIQVLGTSFNVNAYGSAIYTTLVEGSVVVSNSNSTEEYKLKPNEQLVNNISTNHISIKEVDSYYFVAWRYGKFAFQGSSLRKVMSDLARWYNIEVVYDGEFDDIKYSGTISRLEKIEEILNLIEMTNQVKFTIKDRRVIVMEK